ncbi:MAG: PD-(D/E)XK nuclease family protein [Candidatus Paceibacterota bacterium]
MAVDQLLKAEFDEYRDRGEMHPSLLGQANLVEAKLFSDNELLKKWRNNFSGLSYHDEGLDATLFGAVDDMLEMGDGSLAVIDYKSSGAKEVSVYDDYKRQMDVYTHILEQLGHKTARKAYFVFYQVDKENGFNGRLPFKGIVKEIDTDPSYVQELFNKAVELARSETPPPGDTECEHCSWAGHHKEYLG